MSRSDWLDPRMMRARDKTWGALGRASEKDLPPLARKFLGRNPGKRLSGHPQESWHQATLFVLAGQPEPVGRIFQGFAYYVCAGHPHSVWYMFESAQLFRWCARRSGLFGWAEVWDVPMAGHKPQGPPFTLGTRLLEHFLEPETSEEFRRFYGGLEAVSGLNSPEGGSVAGLNHLVEALERSVIGLRDPEMNDVGLSEERLLELIDFYARMIRMWMELPQEQPVPEPDFSVDLPAEFQGFGPQVR